MSGVISRSPPVAGKRSAAAPSNTPISKTAVRMVFPSQEKKRLRTKFEGEQLAGVARAADRNHQILLPVHHVGHRRSTLRGGHVDRADFLPVGLVESAQHRTALTGG